MLKKILIRTAFALGLVMAAPAHADGLSAETQAIIAHYRMENIPHEGAWFVQTHKSGEVIEGALAARYRGKRYAYTSIYALLTAQDFSAMHRLSTDEIWHFYGGSPALMLLLYPDGRGETRVWGANVLAGEEPQIMVPRGTWMGARPIGDASRAYSFGGMTMAPGFEYADYEGGHRAPLAARYPGFARQIGELTRPGGAAQPELSSADASAQPEPQPVAITALVGRDAPQRSERLSTAHFVLQPGAEIPTMRTREGHEVMIVVAGEGSVSLGGHVQSVAPGSVVYLPPLIPHAIKAGTRLEFYVAAAPAWRQTDTEVIAPQE